MAKRMTDADFVERIVEDMKGKSNRLVADAIVKRSWAFASAIAPDAAQRT
jgi:hypothetical protein